MKSIIWKKPDGSIAVSHPNYKCKLSGETEQEFLDRIAAKDGVAGATRYDVDRSTLPTKRTFREAWTFNTAIETDMTKAVDIKLTNIRKDRNDRLSKADGPTARAAEQGRVSHQPWKDYKQALRDTPDITKLTGLTEAQLEAYEPTWPGEPSG